ncbi:MAG TPA: CDP-tyvelose epimerase, partial [Opitutaceae bacterium]|nr:CDP-tyvelose epimerase [Opitutaceae bacterium]
TLLEKQFTSPKIDVQKRIINVSGGMLSAMSLRQLSDWCTVHLGPHSVTSDSAPRPFDIPWIVLDFNKASELWDWCPITPTHTILEEIADHAKANPHWLDLSAPL